MSDSTKPVSSGRSSEGSTWKPWAAWLAAWAAGLTFVVPVELERWRDAAGDGLEAVLVGINVDTAPYLLWLVLGLLLAPWRFERLLATGGRTRRLAAWWMAPAGGGGAGVAISVLLVAATSLAASLHVASHPVAGPGTAEFGSLPPAFHDEYSYLFQAHTFVEGQWVNTAHNSAARLFDQMHVLNENGVFASRYFPGVGAWMAPFVAWEKPTWGHFLAGLITAVAILGVGRELAGNGVGLLAGLLTAAAPGMALFSNLLLSHHPALAGLSVFIYGFLRMQRSGTAGFGLVAGMGLALAMLCRPLTAAAVGLPFGCWLAWWWIRGGGDIRTGRRHRNVACIGVPVLLGMAVMGWYNHQLTGDWATTPYRVFTDKHTPRHVFGFDNVVRGEQRIAEMDAASRERVLDHYDRWAENLDLELAVRNVVSRVIESGKWTVGLVTLVMTSVVLLIGFLIGAVPLPGRRWLPIVLAIASLHLAHVPYWYAGIMNWHYVFESGPLWCLLVAGVTVGLWQVARRVGRPGLALAWTGLLLVSPMTSYQSFDPVWSPSRIGLAVGEVGFARKQHEEFRNRVRQRVKEDRALVLVDPDPADRHIDFVVNEPTLDAAVLVGRYVPKLVPLSEVLRTFPERRVFVYDARTGRLREVRR